MKKTEDDRAALKIWNDADFHYLEAFDGAAEQFVLEQGLEAQFLTWADEFVKIRVPEQKSYGPATVFGNEQVFLFEKPAKGPEQLIIFIIMAMKIKGVVGKALII